MKGNKNPKQLYIMGILITLIYVLGHFAANIKFIGGRSYSIMLVAAAMVTFFGFLRLKLNARIDERSMRTAIAASIFVSYLLMVITVTFFTRGGALPQITETLLSHFTTIVGVVVAFYFGTSAYTEVKGKKETDPNMKKSGKSDWCVGLFQKDVARIIGVSTDTIANWEKGRTKPSKKMNMRRIRLFLENPHFLSVGNRHLNAKSH